MARDLTTPDLFGERVPVQPGSLACTVEVAHTMAEALKDCAHDRKEVAARMSRFLGRVMTEAMLNAYTSEARETHNVSLERAIAFDHATESFRLLALHARKCGAQVVMGNDVLLTEIGRIELQKRELAEREKALRVLARSGR